MSVYSWDTEAVNAVQSGTGWVLDVTAANLSNDLDEKDFVVAFDGTLVDTSQFVKTSATSIRYDGVSTASVNVEVRRNTSVAPFRLSNYADVILSGDYNRNLERYSRLLAEQRAFGATPPGEVSINAALYGATWAADTVNGASRSALYTKFEAVEDDYTSLVSALDASTSAAIALRAPLDSPNLTGTPTAPTPPSADNSGALATTEWATIHTTNRLTDYAPLASPALTGTPTAPTAAEGTDTTQLATTAFVQTETRMKYASNLSSYIGADQLPWDGSPVQPSFGVNGGTIVNHRGTGGAAGGYTAPAAGFYSVSALGTVVTTVGTSGALLLAIMLNGVVTAAIQQLNGLQAGRLAVSHLFYLNAGDIVRIQLQNTGATGSAMYDIHLAVYHFSD